MGQLPGRALAKLVILPCKPVGPKLLPIGIPFVAPYNPTSFSFNAGSDLVSNKTSSLKVSPQTNKGTEPKTLSVEFLLDGTGASPPLGLSVGSALGAAASSLASSSGVAVSAINAEAAARAVVSSVSVTAWVNYFFGIMANLKTPLEVKKTMSLNFATTDKKLHDSRPVKIIWGAGLFFNCRLESATVNYKLFNQLGLPLRATISASFKEWAPDPSVLAAALAALFQSPDLTKMHTVKAGDTIYNLAKQEYDDESYYLQIAKANDLRNYRRLVPGQQLILPPIAKVEE